MPATCAIVSAMPEITTNPYSHVLLSRLHPDTQVKWHQGSSNVQLTLHLGLDIPDGAGIQVDEWRGGWKDGKVTVFDDSFVHRVWHGGKKNESRERLVLLLRMWHPQLSPVDRAMVINYKPGIDWKPKKVKAVTKLLTSDKGVQARWEQQLKLFEQPGYNERHQQAENKVPPTKYSAQDGGSWSRERPCPCHGSFCAFCALPLTLIRFRRRDVREGGHVL